jgi:hypothetical protein
MTGADLAGLFAGIMCKSAAANPLFSGPGREAEFCGVGGAFRLQRK